jgi:hypothetical protein
MCGCGVSSVDPQGLPASPGTGTGEIVFSSDEAEEMMKVRVTLFTLICMHVPTSSGTGWAVSDVVWGSHG